MANVANLNVFCTICSDHYCTQDTIWSLSCGHVFHKDCLERWYERNSSCPQCRVSNPDKRRIFLNLMNLESENNSEFSASQESLIKRVSLLEHKLEENEKNFFDVQLALSDAETRVTDLRSELEMKRVRIESYDQKLQDIQLALEDSETNLMGSLGELTKAEGALRHKQSSEAPQTDIVIAVKTEALEN